MPSICAFEFKNLSATFFKVGSVSQNWFEKDVRNGHSRIHGRVPKYNKTIPAPESYTVSGLDISNNVVTTLDPNVIVDEP